MRKFLSAFKQHLEQEVTTLCQCWIIRRADGQVLGFTDHDRALTIEGVVCDAASGFQPTEAVSSLGLSVDNQDVAGVLSADAISEDDLQAGRFDSAHVEIWLVNWCAPDQRHHMRTAILGETTREDGLFKAELRGLSSILDQSYGRSYTRSCDAVLGDSRCGVNIASPSYRAETQVEAVINRRMIRCQGLQGFPSDWFAQGNLVWTTGRNAGTSVEVEGFSGERSDVLMLWRAMPFTPEAGDQFSVTAGCDKSMTSCRDKFANLVNFQGFPHMPGSDFTLGVAKRDAVHDGSPLVP